MPALLWCVQQQHNRTGGCWPSCLPHSMQPVVLFLLITSLLGCRLATADITDVIATASNYALADVASVNAKLIEDLLKYKWNATSSSILRDALKSATAKPGIYGAAAAFSLIAIRQHNITVAPLYSPYCHEPPAATTDTTIEEITCMDIGNLDEGDGYNYTDASLPQTNWYTQFYSMPKPMPKMSGVYFDKGAGEIWMDTYSVPVMSADNKTMLAVATADIRIDEGARSNTTAKTAQSSGAAAAGDKGSRHVLLLLASLLAAMMAGC